MCIPAPCWSSWNAGRYVVSGEMVKIKLGLGFRRMDRDAHTVVNIAEWLRSP
ncbi:MAG: hypothetical protein U0929_13750 [Planctomycetaceae bacterium]